MQRTTIRPISLALIVLVVLGIVVVTHPQATAEYVQHALTLQAGPVTTPNGPEADPYLRHAPGSYDYELEPPPERCRNKFREHYASLQVAGAASFR